MRAFPRARRQKSGSVGIMAVTKKGLWLRSKNDKIREEKRGDGVYEDEIGVGNRLKVMIPVEEEARSGRSSYESEDRRTRENGDHVLLAGYKECANEALTWLLNLGYEPGHPLIRSLVAHLTKRQAYLEKLDLEQFLIGERMKKDEEIADGEKKGGKDKNDDYDDDDDGDDDDDDDTTAYEYIAYQIKNDKETQRALVEAVFRGCDLQYKKV